MFMTIALEVMEMQIRLTSWSGSKQLILKAVHFTCFDEFSLSQLSLSEITSDTSRFWLQSS